MTPYLADKAFTEFEIHAVAYFALKAEFPIVRADIKTPRKKGERSHRPDLLIFDSDKTLIAVVEVKRGPKARPEERSNQVQRYKEYFACPVILIRGMTEAQNAPQIVKDKLTGGGL